MTKVIFHDTLISFVQISTYLYWMPENWSIVVLCIDWKSDGFHCYEYLSHWPEGDITARSLLHSITHRKLEGSKSFFHYFDRFFRNLDKTDRKLGFFGLEYHKIIFLFPIFITKSSNFISNINDDFFAAPFEVYYVPESKKLAILWFSSKILFTLSSLTSITSWAQTMCLSNLTDVSNFSWR